MPDWVYNTLIRHGNVALPKYTGDIDKLKYDLRKHTNMKVNIREVSDVEPLKWDKPITKKWLIAYVK